MTEQIVRIKELRDKIKESISPLIDNDYIFIELPFYINPGDALIWKGTETFLSELPYKCLHRAAFSTFDFIDIPKDTIIVMQGGGNFGNLYRSNQDFRLAVIEKYPDNKIIILPQTVFYKDTSLLRKDVLSMRKHKHLTICARDYYSYDFLRRFRFSGNIMLVPDMAFYCDLDFIHSLSVGITKERIIFKRIDDEYKQSQTLDTIINQSTPVSTDISDWEIIEHPNDTTERLREMILGNSPHSSINEYALDTLLPYMIETGIKQISSYNEIITTRLHAAILALLLGKKITILDNSYGKNSHFYDTWLQDTCDITCIKEKIYHDWKRTLQFGFIQTILRLNIA